MLCHYVVIKNEKSELHFDPHKPELHNRNYVYISDI